VTIAALGGFYAAREKVRVGDVEHLRMPVFVIHYTKLSDRRAAMEKQLDKHGISADWITQYDKEELNNYPRDRFRWIKEFGWLAVGSGDISLAETSLYFKHKHAFEKIVAGNAEMALILEDDAVLSNGFVLSLNKYVSELDHSNGTWDVLSLGSCQGGDQVPVKEQAPGVHVYRKQLPKIRLSGGEEHVFPGLVSTDNAMRCADSYVVTRTAAQLFLKDMLPVSNMPVDAFLNIMFHQHQLSMWWAAPTLVSQVF
jgi:GR25 family glycosyltransferase involved in LPS biosynthesis